VVTAAHARTRDDIVRLAHRGLPVPEFARAVGRAVLRVVPAEGTCLMTLDPATLLPTAEYVENGLPAAGMLRLVEIEVREPDFTKWTQLARAEQPAASLSAATAGDLDRSLRQREVRRPAGFGDELRAVLAGSTGAWGALTVFREARRPYFSAADVQFVSSAAGLIADGLRRGLLLDAAHRGVGDVGLLVLDTDDGVHLSNPAAERWLDELGAGDRAGARMPLVVPAVARRARAIDDPDPVPATARARTRRGRWVIVRGSLMGDGPHAPVAIVLEAARPAEMAPLVADAYGFTDAERRVTELVARGLSTRQISGRLRVSTHTVQDHLKSIFAKSGAGSRGELVAAVFLGHHTASLTS
jgi:DNA-binding CsgD family transcriptional regulator/GAF domain-containing protein